MRDWWLSLSPSERDDFLGTALVTVTALAMLFIAIALMW
jgi:hypothetical protein